MLAVITRFLTILAVAIVFAWLANGFWGQYAAFVTGLAVLSVPLIYAYFNLARLQKFILLNRVEALPAASFKRTLIKEPLVPAFAASVLIGVNDTVDTEAATLMVKTWYDSVPERAGVPEVEDSFQTVSE